MAAADSEAPPPSPPAVMQLFQLAREWEAQNERKFLRLQCAGWGLEEPGSTAVRCIEFHNVDINSMKPASDWAFNELSKSLSTPRATVQLVRVQPYASNNNLPKKIKKSSGVRLNYGPEKPSPAQGVASWADAAEALAKADAEVAAAGRATSKSLNALNNCPSAELQAALVADIAEWDEAKARQDEARAAFAAAATPEAVVEALKAVGRSARSLLAAADRPFALAASAKRFAESAPQAAAVLNVLATLPADDLEAKLRAAARLPGYVYLCSYITIVYPTFIDASLMAKPLCSQ